MYIGHEPLRYSESGFTLASCFCLATLAVMAASSRTMSSTAARRCSSVRASRYCSSSSDHSSPSLLAAPGKGQHNA